MTIDLSPEQEALVRDSARYQARSVGEVVAEAVLWLAETEEEELASTLRGIEELDSGEFIDHQVMEERVARMLGR
jgi:predicted transcriptional regulator